MAPMLWASEMDSCYDRTLTRRRNGMPVGP